MISLQVKSNTVRKTIIVDVNSTPRGAMSANGISTNTAVHLNGEMLVGGDLDETFAELGVQDDTDAILISVIKADSAR